MCLQANNDSRYVVHPCVPTGKWRDSAVPTHADNYLQQKYFMDLEAHWGGCGGWEWSKKWKLPTKFALGIAFKIVPVVEGGKHIHVEF